MAIERGQERCPHCGWDRGTSYDWETSRHEALIPVFCRRPNACAREVLAGKETVTAKEE
jgi:hypothetical protein